MIHANLLRPKTRTTTSTTTTSPPKPSPESPPHSSNAKTLTLPSKMSHRSKSLLKPALAILFLLLSSYAFFNTFFSPNPNINNPFVYSQRQNPITNSPPVVKVYMYDLPRKFTYGVIESYAIARGGIKVQDDSLLIYPGNQHSAEWYLFSDLNRVGRVDSVVTRVLDPEQADLFYVPFFSSLSLVANPIRPATVKTMEDGHVYYNDEEMQVGLIEWLEEHWYWKRNNGWDHVFVCQDPNALYKVVERVKSGVLLVSDFGRLGRDQASLVKDVILPYSHRIKTFGGDVGVESRNSLLFFMGNRYRKEGGKVRDLLFQILENEEGVTIKHGAQSRESRRAASQGMHTSKFCLHPAVFVDTNSAVKPGYLSKLLRRVSTERILEFQQELKKVKRYFEYEDPNGTVNEIWRQVSLKLPLIKLMINRDKRLVKRELPEPDCSCLCSNQSGINTTL
ncbi:probable arabinosyltransferase ARAD1 isoform X2 [Rhododendron vialii]|uniref:probable arabinosyltransferase ARAD1 isoform X2 n=1 Tax=Rhododendron vialii TaxID=182163 RepID=UPI00265ECFE6|nr:probable arabinosyltransferase ARAD1 isoform X2 [Rhododendron vialii]